MTLQVFNGPITITGPLDYVATITGFSTVEFYGVPYPPTLGTTAPLTRWVCSAFGMSVRQRRNYMFSGTAVLTDPEKNVTVATFTERCDDYGAATVNVILIDPITLKGTERLAIFAKGNPEPMIAVGASDPIGTVIDQFGGTSAIGCVLNGAEISLTSTPGGNLGTLLRVLGQGTISPS
jgi:hypothetical protein